MAERSYRIQVAAQVSGVKAQLIRAWERRYGVLHPERTAGGYRAYSEAVGALQALRRHGLKSPDDISIIGIDGHEMAEFSELTTIEQPVTLMGEMAAWSIMERLRKPNVPVPSLVLPTTLVVRNTTRRLLPGQA